MFRVFSCLTNEHDWRLVVLAGLVCLLASLVAVSSFRRARAASGRARHAWLMLAGAATGCGIWATHFIAMLAYEPGIAVAYDLWLTALSLILAIAITSAGFATAAIDRYWAPAVGGAVLGAGVAGMHYTGMWALLLPGHLSWSLDLVVVSIGLCVAFSAVALTAAVRAKETAESIAAAMLLTLAIVAHHFIAMGAVQVVPDPTQTFHDYVLSPPTLALAIAGAAIAILGMSLVGAIADSYLSTRTQQFADARKRLIDKSEAQLRQQNVRLDTALNNMTQGLCMFDANEEIVVFNRRFLEMHKLSPQVVRPGCTLRDLIHHRKEVGLLEDDPD